ncbi:MAG TPA: hypothetical protein PLJ27_14910 [Polyangiaceae bacterium]|nr:hypothetical protein [Polyangiaceae bacterium]HOD23131.1 hypothetical protein [Polyangiaceae bacterium]HOT12785.1 hypothetical protein [Polyangiaceae bacterium]HPY19992.1 hypothetical protein [Polyangiaceae bacterium]HQK18746.1 hypothetical protein [Polyangiaceae bacterium]
MRFRTAELGRPEAKSRARRSELDQPEALAPMGGQAVSERGKGMGVSRTHGSAARASDLGISEQFVIYG